VPDAGRLAAFALVSFAIMRGTGGAVMVGLGLRLALIGRKD
jgi:hypothetical protein